MKNNESKNSSIPSEELAPITTIEPFPTEGLSHPIQAAIHGETATQMESRARMALNKHKVPFIEAAPELVQSYAMEEEMGTAPFIMLHGIRIAYPGTGATQMKKEQRDTFNAQHGDGMYFEGRGSAKA